MNCIVSLLLFGKKYVFIILELNNGFYLKKHHTHLILSTYCEKLSLFCHGKLDFVLLYVFISSIYFIAWSTIDG